VDDRLLTTPCTLVSITAGALDEYGDATRTETSTDTRCHLQQDQAVEGENAAVEETRWRIYLPADVSLSGIDHLEIASEAYALTGDPWPVIRPTTGQVDHVECQARRVR
jgi:hypothetical protein